MFSSLFDSAVKTVDDFIEEPLQTTINITTQPIVDGCDLLGGLTEEEFRYKAALRLGTDVVAGMAIGELVEAMADE